MKRKLSIPIVDKWNKKSNPSNPLPEFSKLPAVLLDRENFLCWKWEWNGKKWTKVPVHGTSTNAYLSFKQAYNIAKKEGLGVGVSLQNGDLVAVDLDDVLNKKGKIKKPFRRILKKVIKTTYCELTPGGTGIRLFYQIDNPEALPTKSVFGKHLEIYWRGRYLTITGVPFQGRKGLILPMGDNLQYLIANLSEKRQTGATGTAGAAGEEVRKPGISIEDAAKQEYIRRHLHRLPRICFDERDIWKDIGLILHNVFHGDAEGLNLFKMFSAQLPEKFNERDTEKVYFSDDPSKPNRYGITRFQEILEEYADYDDAGDDEEDRERPGSHRKANRKPLKPIYKDLFGERGINILYGRSGAGKSTFLVTEVIPSILKKHQKFRLLTLFSDNPEMNGVLETAVIHKGLDPEKYLSQGACETREQFMDEVKYLKKHPKECRDLLIVVDVFKSLVDNTNSHEGNNKFFEDMRQLTNNHATVIIVAHGNKKPEKDGRFIYEGTGGVKDKVDVLMQVDRELLSKSDIEKGKNFHLTVEVEKSRIIEAFEGLFHTWSVNGKIQPRLYNIAIATKKMIYSKERELSKCYHHIGKNPINFVEKMANQRMKQMEVKYSGGKVKLSESEILTFFLDFDCVPRSILYRQVGDGIIKRQSFYRKINSMINAGILGIKKNGDVFYIKNSLNDPGTIDD